MARSSMRTRAYLGSGSSALAAGAANQAAQISPSMATNEGARALVPGTTISAIVKVYTVPAGYTALFQGAVITGGATGSSVSIFWMADAATTPVATDRLSITAVGANTSAATPNAGLFLDEGASIWVFSSVNNDTAFWPNITLFKKPILGGTYTILNTKQIQSDGTDVLLYTSTGWTEGAATQAMVSNTTGGALTAIFKVVRFSDSATITESRASIAANATNGYSGTFLTLGPGDKLYWNGSATGFNLSLTLLDRPTV